MTVYIDDMQRPARVGRISARWSHLLADSSDELMTFARRLGLRPAWLQHPGTPREHFDVTETKRQQALALGAVPIRYGREGGTLTLAKARGQAFDLAGFRAGTWTLRPAITDGQDS